MIVTERINLPDGNWWEIRARLTHGMQKTITRIILAALPNLASDGKILNQEEITSQLYGNVGRIDIQALNDAYLLAGTVAYSYGPVVNMETIDGIAEEDVRKISDRMNELYNPQQLTEEQRGTFFAKPSPVT